MLAEIKREAGCARCGIDDPRVLDLHHRDGAQKILAVSQLIVRASWQAVLDEVAQCTVLCANCHRIIHTEREGQAEQEPIASPTAERLFTETSS